MPTPTFSLKKRLGFVPASFCHVQQAFAGNGGLAKAVRDMFLVKAMSDMFLAKAVANALMFVSSFNLPLHYAFLLRKSLAWEYNKIVYL